MLPKGEGRAGQWLLPGKIKDDDAPPHFFNLTPFGLSTAISVRISEHLESSRSRRVLVLACDAAGGRHTALGLGITCNEPNTKKYKRSARGDSGTLIFS